MTTMINLLPWREERRKQRQHEFIAMLAFAALLAGLIFWLWKFSRISTKHIQGEIAKLDTQIKEINELQRRRDQLVARMKVIQELQGNRPTIVYVFDQLVRTLPEGVYYTLVERTGDSYRIEGVAESNNRISRLMRNLAASDWFVEPNLLNVNALDESERGGADGADSAQANTFALTVKQGSPRSDDEEAGQ